LGPGKGEEEEEESSDEFADDCYDMSSDFEGERLDG
jgi:hypothetical protein